MILPTVTQKEEFILIEVAGRLEVSAVVDTIRRHYPSLGDRNVLWDLTRADISSLTLDELRQIAEVARATMNSKRFTRIVYIGVAPALYNKMCLYTAIAAMAETPADYAVFQTQTDAVSWLKRGGQPVGTSKAIAGTTS